MAGSEGSTNEMGGSWRSFREDQGGRGRLDQPKWPSRQAAHAIAIAIAVTVASAAKTTNELGTFHVKRSHELAGAEARLSQNGQNAI